MNYENPARFEESLVFRGAAWCRSLEGCPNERDSRDACGFGHALHGRARTQRRRPAARSFATGECPFLEENN